MARKTYEEKLRNINLWVEITNHHWHRLKGNIYNDTEFWDDTLHSMSNDDWWDWTDIAPALKIQHEDFWRRYSKLDISTEAVKRTLMLNKSVVKKSRKGSNFEAFRLLMNIKDFINDINFTPTVDYSTRTKEETQDVPSQFELLFDKE
jgi:hypothetical protein